MWESTVEHGIIVDDIVLYNCNVLRQYNLKLTCLNLLTIKKINVWDNGCVD